MSSIQPRKQRLALHNQPHHVARKTMASHLSEELLLKYNRRSVTVIFGDEVTVMRGEHQGKSGKIVAVDVPARKVNIEGVTNKKADGTEVALPVHPSNLKIIRLNLEDKRRVAKLEASGATRPAEKTQKASKKAAKPATTKAAKATPSTATKEAKTQ